MIKKVKVLSVSPPLGDGALSSRILEGVVGNSFAYPKETEDRRY